MIRGRPKTEKTIQPEPGEVWMTNYKIGVTVIEPAVIIGSVTLCKVRDHNDVWQYYTARSNLVYRISSRQI
jgi:hypothetical protein